jgi:hypothetical protein
VILDAQGPPLAKRRSTESAIHETDGSIQERSSGSRSILEKTALSKRNATRMQSMSRLSREGNRCPDVDGVSDSELAFESDFLI